MKIKIVSIFISLSIIACSNKPKQENGNTIVSDSVTSIMSESYELEDEEYDEAIFSNYSHEGIKVFEPIPYNLSDYSQQFFNIMDTITGLFRQGDKYCMKECRITKTNVFEGDCNGAALIEPTLDTNSKCLFLFRGLKKFNINEQINLVDLNKRMHPGSIESFDLRGIEYKLISKGDVLKLHNQESDMYYENTINYKLYLSDGEKSQCILRIKELKDTMVEVCFVGDLDSDGKPDLIIKSPSTKKDYCLLLYLSSYAQDRELVKLVSVLIDSFDC